MISPHPDYIPCSFCGRSLCVENPQSWEPVLYYMADLVFEVKVVRKNFKQVWSDDKKRVTQAHIGTDNLRLCGQCLHRFTKECTSAINPNFPF